MPHVRLFAGPVFGDDNAPMALDCHVDHADNFGWGRVYLYNIHNGDNQLWALDSDKREIWTKHNDYRLSVKENSDAVGCAPFDASTNQKWEISLVTGKCFPFCS